MTKDQREEIDQMTDDQKYCVDVLSILYKGKHHFDGPVRCFGEGISMSTWQGLATYDFASLTTMVLLAHKHAVRFEIKPSGPGMVKLILSKRKTDGDTLYTKHPSLNDLIAAATRLRDAPKGTGAYKAIYG